MLARLVGIACALSVLLCGCSSQEAAPAAPAAQAEQPAAAPEATPAPAAPPAAAPAAPAETAEAQPEPPKPDLSKFALKIDPSCGMDLEKTPVAATYEYQGKTYGFCSDFCKKTFAEDPEKALVRIGHPEGQ